LGQMHNNMHYYKKAFDDYQIALKHRPNDAKVLSNMGYIYFMQGNLEKAEEVYRNSIKYDPRFVDARRNLGAVMAMKKQFPAAIEQWQEALKYDPNNGTLLFYIGSAYKDMGQMEKAQPWLDRAKAAGVGQ
jgi:protein O-GlcNAc transferase